MSFVRPTDVHSLTAFTRKAKQYIDKILTSKSPVTITINGEGRIVVQDAQEYEAMIDQLERAKFVTALLQGERDISEGRTLDIEESFNQTLAALELQS